MNKVIIFKKGQSTGGAGSGSAVKIGAVCIVATYTQTIMGKQ